MSKEALKIANDWASWAADAIATATQDRKLLEGDQEYDHVLAEAIKANTRKAIINALEHAGRGVCRQCNGRGLHHPSPDPSVIGTGPCSLCGGSGKGAPDFSQPPAPITCQLYGHEVQGCGECTPPAPVVPEGFHRVLTASICLAHDRKGDVSDEDGSYATTPIDHMIELETALCEVFDTGSDDVIAHKMVPKMEAMLNAAPEPPAPVVPEPLTVSQCSTSQYCQGWNECREAMLVAMREKSQ